MRLSTTRSLCQSRYPWSLRFSNAGWNSFHDVTLKFLAEVLEVEASQLHLQDQLSDQLLRVPDGQRPLERQVSFLDGCNVVLDPIQVLEVDSPEEGKG